MNNISLVPKIHCSAARSLLPVSTFPSALLSSLLIATTENHDSQFGHPEPTMSPMLGCSAIVALTATAAALRGPSHRDPVTPASSPPSSPSLRTSSPLSIIVPIGGTTPSPSPSWSSSELSLSLPFSPFETNNLDPQSVATGINALQPCPIVSFLSDKFPTLSFPLGP